MATPYAISSDLVSAWPAKSQAVATYLDGALAAKAALAGATYTGAHDFTGATVTGIGGGTVLASGSLSGASVVLSAIAQTYRDLLLVIEQFQPTAQSGLDVRLNNDTTADYHVSKWTGDRQGVGGISGAAASTSVAMTPGYQQPASNTAALFQVAIYNYASVTRKLGEIRSAFGADGSRTMLASDFSYAGTAGISRLDLICSASTFAGGTYKLIGVK